MGKILSIIIPTYNMEAYLRQCLNSLVISEKNMMLLEVLVVNDGSKDSSLQIGREYESKYPNTFRVIDKENGNYGSCVNRGLKEATGKYVKVLDADDSFYNDNLDRYVTILTSVEDDMVLTEYDLINSDTKVLRHLAFSLPCDVSFSVNKIKFSNWFRMHAITYRTEILKKNNYNQTEGISYTDIEWSTIPLMYISSVRYCKLCIYRYLVGRVGQTVDPKVKQKNLWMNKVVFYKLLESYLVNYNSLGDAKEIIYSKLYQLSCSIYKIALSSRDCELMALITDFDHDLNKKCPKLYSDLNYAIFSKYLSCKYIRDWRENPQKKYLYWNVYKLLQKVNNKYHLIG